MKRLACHFFVFLAALLAGPSAPAAPQRLGDGVFSTSADEFGGAITPDGKTIYFNRSVPRSYFYVICVSHLRHGQWSRPEIAPFSGRWRDSDPVLSPDGHRLYFVSDRPWPGQKKPNFDVWVVDLAGPRPNIARHMDGAVNSDENEYFASEASDGTIYVASERKGSIGGADVYRVKRAGGKYPVAENLGEPVNAKGAASLDALIAPDQSFLIIGSFGRSAPGDSDLFISRNNNGVWSAPEPLAAVNTGAREYSPRFSPDGKDLIFTSERGIPAQLQGVAATYDMLASGAAGIDSGLGNIYRIPLGELGLPDLPIHGAAVPLAKETAHHAVHGAQRDPSRKEGDRGPHLFAPNVISTAALAEMGGTFSPDGRDFYFVVRTPTTTSLPLSAICVSHRIGDTWQKPVVAPFSGRDFDAGPAMSPDGKRLFFSSNRPVNGAAREDADLWYVERTEDGWSEPHNVGAPVNSERSEVSPSVAADGTLYFASDRQGGRGSYDLYRSKLAGGRYQEPENLGPEINSEAAELTPFISPDQRLLLFSAIGRPDMKLGGGNPYARGDLYASEWKDGAWTPARRLPEPVNSVATESYPVLSRDGKTLYFSSERSPFVVPVTRAMTFDDFDGAWHRIQNGLSNIYSVPAREAGLHLSEATPP
ncbi:MAG TPA: hypothetical protein VEZ11_09795 [Thermoanaerobaculia bacterium]|nr:hypothetical protein [Thermoanaerobaculia bacterium]